MKKILLLILYISFTVGLQAQEKKGNTLPSKQDSTLTDTKDSNTTLTQDQFSLPSPIPSTHDFLPFPMYGITPFRYQGYNTWDLHKGFNASLGMNVSVGFGKHALHGVGFGQDAAFLYAIPINKRLSVAAGVYATNMQWADYTYRNAGIAGIAAFKVNDCITLYGYGNKSIMPKKRLPAYPLPNFSPDKIGGMVNFKVGESAFISVGVEAIKNDHPYRYYYW